MWGPFVGAADYCSESRIESENDLDILHFKICLAEQKTTGNILYSMGSELYPSQYVQYESEQP